MPIFYFAPEERFGGPAGLQHLVQECHKNGIAVILDMVYAHKDRMFTYQIGYEKFFNLWEDDHYSDAKGIHRSPNPLVCAYDEYGKKNDWRMLSTKQFFVAVNAFWLQEYHIDGFRYDHVNGFLDRKPIVKDGAIDWSSQENRPTFVSLQELSKATYQNPRNILVLYLCQILNLG
jgi:1,4-alpha-glucan branching enzyme